MSLGYSSQTYFIAFQRWINYWKIDEAKIKLISRRERMLLFSFKLNISTNNVLMFIIENIQGRLSDNEFSAEVFVDLKKAFDRVDDKKLEHCGIRSIAKDWFCSYLANRKQFVLVIKLYSTIQKILTVFPQGSVLGPPLFLIYIIDFNSCIRYSRTYHFVDDPKILNSDKSLYTLVNEVNCDLKNLSQWLKANKFSLNVKKTELIIFRQKKKPQDDSVKFKSNGRRLFPTSSVKYLGVFLDDQLYWGK